MPQPRATVTRTIECETLYRAAEFDVVERADGEAGDRTINIRFSSEEPVARWFGEEILDHSPDAVRTDFLNSGRAPLLLDHFHRDIVGVIESGSIGNDRAGHATARFGKSAKAEEALQDVHDKIRNNVSVGYRIIKVIREVDENDRETFRVSEWEPLEISLVAIGADSTAQVKRDRTMHTVEIIEREATMPQENTPNADPTPDATRAADPTPTPSPAVVVDTSQTREAVLQREETRSTEIMALAVRHNLREFGNEHVRASTSLEAFKGLLLERLPESTPLADPAGALDLSHSDQQRYSIINAMRYLASEKGDRAAESAAGFEIECSQTIGERLGGRQPRGMFIPADMRMRDDFNPIAMRAQTAGTPADGGHLVGTDHLGGSFIDALRNALVLRDLGVRMLTGLVGNVEIPKMSTGSTATIIAAEGGNAAESDPVYAQVTLTPRTLGAYTDVSRRLLMQSDPSVDGLARDDLLLAAAVGMESYALTGTGSSGQPTGLLNVSGIGDVSHGTNGGAPDWATTIEHITDVESANAAMGNLGWLTNASVWGAMMSTPRVAGFPRYILEDPGRDLIGYPLRRTQNMPGNLTKGSGTNLGSLVYGNWSDLIIGEWGVIDLLADPYTLSRSGGVRFNVHMDFDVAVRRAASFAASQDIIY